MTHRRVAVIGAGVTGLATAWHLRDDVEMVVFGADERVGGQVETIDLAGVPMDVGADAYLARRPEAEALVRAVGFGDDDIVVPTTGRVALWVRGRLRPLPAETVLGAPADLRAVLAGGVLTLAGAARAALEPVLPRRRVVGDRSIGDLVGERFGHEVVDTLVEPLLGGVYAGAADRLSAQAAAPPIWTAAATHRSLLAGLAAHRRHARRDARPVFGTLRGGLSTLTARLADDLGDRVRVGTPVTAITATPDGRWELSVAEDRSGHAVGHDPAGGDRADVGVRGQTFDEVVLAVPAAVAARLLAPLAPEAARELAGIRTASVGVVALAYDRADATEAPAVSGVLVPRREGRLIKAVTVSSRKWPHHDRPDRFVVRASVGRIDDGRALSLDDAVLAERVDAEVRDALRLDAPALERRVVRWEDALPQYDVGHLARVERIRTALSGLSRIHVGGAALDGVGLAARAADAQRLARAVRSRPLSSTRSAPPGTR